MQRPDYHIIVKRFKEQASGAERDQLASWLKGSILRREEYKKLKAIWDAYGKHHETYPVNAAGAFDKVEEEMRLPRLRTLTFYKIAACIAVLLIAGLTIDRMTPGVANDLQVFVGEEEGKEVLLQDGSLVLLRAGSTLTLSADFVARNREVALDGGAFFDVSHDPDKPFIIQAGEISVEVLGTSFLITPLQDQTEVALFRGEVEVYAKNQKVNLVPNQTAIFKEAVLSKASQSANSMSWRTKKLDFEYERLDKVFRDLERHYQVKIQLGEGVAEKLLTTSFDDQPLNEVLKVISSIHRLEIIKRTNNDYHILLQ